MKVKYTIELLRLAEKDSPELDMTVSSCEPLDLMSNPYAVSIKVDGDSPFLVNGPDLIRAIKACLPHVFSS